MFDLLTDIGWRPATSGSFMQERFKSTFVLRYDNIKLSLCFFSIIDEQLGSALERKFRMHGGGRGLTEV